MNHPGGNDVFHAGSDRRKVAIVPCSGLGKTYGSVSREAAYIITEELRPESSQLILLSLLVLGDDEARQAVSSNPIVAIDGCKLSCARKMTEESGGNGAVDFIVLDVYRRYRTFKPQGIAELNEGGLKLAQALAEEVVTVIDQMTENFHASVSPEVQMSGALEGGQDG